MPRPWRFFGRRWTQIRQADPPSSGEEDSEESLENSVPSHGETVEAGDPQNNPTPNTVHGALQIEPVQLEVDILVEVGERPPFLTFLRSLFYFGPDENGDDPRLAIVLFLLGFLVPPFPWMMGTNLLYLSAQNRHRTHIWAMMNMAMFLLSLMYFSAPDTVTKSDVTRPAMHRQNPEEHLPPRYPEFKRVERYHYGIENESIWEALEGRAEVGLVTLNYTPKDEEKDFRLPALGLLDVSRPTPLAALQLHRKVPMNGLRVLRSALTSTRDLTSGTELVDTPMVDCLSGCERIKEGDLDLLQATISLVAKCDEDSQNWIILWRLKEVNEKYATTPRLSALVEDVVVNLDKPWCTLAFVIGARPSPEAAAAYIQALDILVTERKDAGEASN